MQIKPHKPFCIKRDEIQSNLILDFNFHDPVIWKEGFNIYASFNIKSVELDEDDEK